jgi:alcohol dehydrogenase class IV
MHFTFSTARNILFGAGTVAEAANEAAHMGKRALLVIGRNPDRAAGFVQRLQGTGLGLISFSIHGEPEVGQITEGAALARRERCDLVIGFGGGSILDGAKAIAALSTNSDPIETYLEVIGQGLPLNCAPLPCIAIPTTAGTGSEVTRNAVLKSIRHKVKVSLRRSQMLPRLAVVDPELTLSLPSDIVFVIVDDRLSFDYDYEYYCDKEKVLSHPQAL